MKPRRKPRQTANPLPIPDKKNRDKGGALVLTILIMVLGFVVYMGLIESGHIAGLKPLNDLIRIGKAEEAPIFSTQPPRKASSGTLTVGDTDLESSQYKDPNSKYKALFEPMDEYFVDLYAKTPVHLLFEDIKYKYVAIDQRSFEEITHPFLGEKGIEFTVVTHWVFAGDQDFYILREQWFAPYNDKGQVVIHGGDTTGMGLILREEDIERGKAAVDWYYKKIGVTREEMDQVMREQLDREEAQREAKEAEVEKPATLPQLETLGEELATTHTTKKDLGNLFVPITNTVLKMSWNFEKFKSLHDISDNVDYMCSGIDRNSIKKVDRYDEVEQKGLRTVVEWDVLIRWKIKTSGKSTYQRVKYYSPLTVDEGKVDLKRMYPVWYNPGEDISEKKLIEWVKANDEIELVDNQAPRGVPVNDDEISRGVPVNDDEISRGIPVNDDEIPLATPANGDKIPRCY